MIRTNDLYTVISHGQDGQVSRLVIAASSDDAAETHREHYPGGAIISVIGD